MFPRPDENTCLMFLLRHGATESNLSNPPTLQGQTVDGQLTDQGLRQAELSAKFLSKHRLSAVYSSPLKRARQTADAIGKPHGLITKPVPELSEIDVGQWEGKTWADIERDDGEAYDRFMRNPEVHGYPGGENLRQVLDRMQPAIERFYREHRGQRIAVVAHNVVNRVFLAHVTSVPLNNATRLSQNNCGINIIRLRDGNTKLITLNAIFHLSPEAVT